MVQVLVFWHMMKVPPTVGWDAVGTQFGSLVVKPQLPQTTPLVRVPVVVVVPFEVPLTPPVGMVDRVRTVLEFNLEATLKVIVPVTAPLEAVFRVADPDYEVVFKPRVKHGPALKKLKPVMSRGWLLWPVKLVKLSAVTKFNWLATWPATPLFPTSWASQFPLVVVVTVLRGVLLPQPETASSSASMTRSASFFMYLPASRVSG